MQTRLKMLAAAVLGLSALTAAADNMSVKDFSGWLGSYDQLVYVEDKNMYVFFNENARGKYAKVMLESISVYGANARSDTAVANQATDYLTTGVRQLFADKGILATEPGPATLRYSMAISGIEKSAESLKAHNLIPVSALYRGVKAASGNLDTFIDATFEAQLVDSISGERVAATVRRGISETEKKSGDALEFSDVKPTLDLWLDSYSRTLDDFLARRE